RPARARSGQNPRSDDPQYRDPMNPPLRLPAEWEPQAAILLAWPHAGTDWAERLAAVEECFIALVAAIARFQPALVCVADADLEAYARARLSSARIDMDRVSFVEVPYNDTWLRRSEEHTSERQSRENIVCR